MLNDYEFKTPALRSAIGLRRSVITTTAAGWNFITAASELSWASFAARTSATCKQARCCSFRIFARIAAARATITTACKHTCAIVATASAPTCTSIAISFFYFLSQNPRSLRVDIDFTLPDFGAFTASEFESSRPSCADKRAFSTMPITPIRRRAIRCSISMRARK